MRKVVFLFLALLPLALFANNSYEINLSKVDVTIQQAVESNNFNLQTEFSANKNSEMLQSSDKNVTTAFILAILVGGFGVHRLYLGTSMGVFIGYLLTGAGCGILYTIDNVLLLISLIQNSPIDSYIDNPHFFMWLQ